MKRVAVIVVALFGCVPMLSAQSGSEYSFKGNYLGMSLADFKAHNGGFSLHVNTGKPGKYGQPDKKYDRVVSTPFCTDELRDFPGDVSYLRADEVLCNASPANVNPDGRTIDGTSLSEVTYWFYSGRLYSIHLYFSTTAYDSVAYLFRLKYGHDPEVSSESYQNAYGASWKGEVLKWRAGKQQIVLDQGSGNGPGPQKQEAFALIWDQSLEPPRPVPTSVDF